MQCASAYDPSAAAAGIPRQSFCGFLDHLEQKLAPPKEPAPSFEEISSDPTGVHDSAKVYYPLADEPTPAIGCYTS